MLRLTAILPLCACMLEASPVDEGTGDSSSGGGGEASASSTSSGGSAGPGSSAGSGSAEGEATTAAAESSGASDGSGESGTDASEGEASTSTSGTDEGGSSSDGGMMAMQGDCAHTLCSSGPPLVGTCDGEQGCVQQICAADGYCCMTWWDEGCVAKVAMICALDC